MHAKCDSPQPGQVQQVLDEPVESLGLGTHRRPGARDILLRNDTIGKRLGIALDRGERRAELVRDRQQELALASL